MAANRRQRYIFQLSGFSVDEKEDLARKINMLTRGVYLKEQMYRHCCTHIVSSKPCRSEKYLAACAAGKWIVRREFLDESFAAGRWLDESAYEYGHSTTSHQTHHLTVLEAPRRWRQKVAKEMAGAFAGWCSIVVVDDQKRRAAYQRLLKAGGATVLSAKTVAASQTVYASQLTHVFLEKKYDASFRTLRRSGVLCLSPDYIAEFLIQNPPADPDKFDVAVYVPSSSNTPVPASAVSGQTGGVATESKSQMSRKATRGRSASSVKGAVTTPTQTTVEDKVLRSLLPSQKGNSSSNVVTKGSISQSSPAKKSLPGIQLMERVSLSPKKGRNESLSTPEGVKKGSIPTPERVRKGSCPTPEKMKKESIPAPEILMKGSFPTQGKAALPTPGTVEVIPSPSQMKLEGVKKRPLLADSGKDRDMLQLMSSKRRKLDLPGACFQPCFPVSNKKIRTTKVSQRAPLPLGPAVCTSVEVALDEQAFPTALGLLQSTLSTVRYPPTHIIHRVMAEALLHAKDGAGAAQAYQVLKQIQTLHPPSRTPATAYMYLKSLRTPAPDQVEKVKGRKGRKQQQAETQKEGIEWDFVKMVISGAVTDTQTTEEASESPLYQSNCALLLKFLVSVIEQDFMAWLDRENYKPGSPPCLLASLLWPSGHCGVITSHVTDLVSLLFQTLHTGHKQQGGGQQGSMVCLLQSLVAMAAECCQATDRHFDRMTSLTGSFSIGTSVCNLAQEIAAIYQKDPANQTKAVLHHLLETLQPPWLKLKVAQSLLGCYDDSLVAREQQGFHKKPLSLKRVLLCYMSLVPKSLVSSQTAPVTKGKEKVPQENPPTPTKVKVEQGRLRRRGSTRGEPLRTLVDANHVKQLPVVRGKRSRPESVSSTPEASPKKKPRLQVNRRNVRGETQLHVACIKNNVTRVRDLLSVPGIDINAQDYAGWTPLHEACNHGHVDVVKELLAFKPQPSVASFFSTKNKDTPVKMSSALNLLAAPPDGTTALHDAVANGHVAVAKLLLDAGGKVLLSQRNASGLMPCDLAVGDEMKAALQAPVTPGRKPQAPLANKSLNCTTTATAVKELPTVLNPTGLNQNISETDYDRLLGQGRTQKTVDECAKFVTVVSHLTRAYVRLEQLQPMRKRREKQLECGSNDSSSTTSTQSSVCSYSNGRFKGANTSPMSPVVVLKDIMLKGKSEEVKGVEEDLTLYMDMDQYLQGYERHLKKLIGEKEDMSEFYKKGLTEIRLCS